MHPSFQGYGTGTTEHFLRIFLNAVVKRMPLVEWIAYYTIYFVGMSSKYQIELYMDTPIVKIDLYKQLLTLNQQHQQCNMQYMNKEGWDLKMLH